MLNWFKNRFLKIIFEAVLGLRGLTTFFFFFLNNVVVVFFRVQI